MEQIKLVKKARKGDDGAFYELMQSHKIRLYRIAFSYFKNENDALEAIQEVTYRAYRSIKKLKQPEYFSTWLIRILLNYCHDELAKRKRWFASDDIVEFVGAEHDSSFLELEDALSNIEERYRQVLYMKYFHDLKIKEIAEVLDCPEGTIKTWLYRGLELLKVELQDKGGLGHV